MKGRIQHPRYTAAALAAANPILLDGEIVFESDTGRSKVGDGVRTWTVLPYRTDGEIVPALEWKVQGGMLCVKAMTDLDNPILERCSVGILHYKNARKRYVTERTTGLHKNRPNSTGFKLVQDFFAKAELSWTAVRINPVSFDLTAARHTGWMPLISVKNLFDRWVTTVPDPQYCGGGKFELHRGHNITSRTGSLDASGKIRMKVSFYGGVVLFTGNPMNRIEGPRAYFKVEAQNFNNNLSVVHI